MLRRSPTVRCQRNKHRPLNVKILKQTGDETRCSDGDSSQSSPKKTPTFASVHRITRHHAGSLKCANDGSNAAMQTSHGEQKEQQGSTAVTCNAAVMQVQRPTFHKYHLQKRMQQQQQQQQQHNIQINVQPASLTNVSDLKNVSWSQNLSKSKTSLTCEKQQHPQLQCMAVRMKPVSSPADVPKKLLNSEFKRTQQQHQLLNTFHQVHNNASNNLLDIYKRNSLSQTIFSVPDLNHKVQKQQQQQQQQLQQEQQTQKCAKKLWSHQSLHTASVQKPGKTLQLLKSPNAPTRFRAGAPPLPIVQQPGFTRSTATASPCQTHFEFSDSYDELVDPNHSLTLEATNYTTTAPPRPRPRPTPPPPPPPAPLNHVYETIRERPLPTPPPPPLLKNHYNAPPPLPPSRLLKKKFFLGTSEHVHKLHRKSSATVKETDNKQLVMKSILLPQPPAYVPPPPLARESRKASSSNYYNTQQRTKADGEQKRCIYQMANDRKLQQQQQQQQQLQCQPKGATNGELQQKQPEWREHPLGAYEEQIQNTINEGIGAEKNKTNNNNNNNNNNGANNKAIAKPKLKPNDVSPVVMMTNEQQNDLCQQDAVENCRQQENVFNTDTNIPKAQPAQPSTSQPLQSMFSDTDALPMTRHQQNRPSALPIVMEEESDEFQDVLLLAEDGTAKLPYRHGNIEVSLETAQAMAAAAYYARAAQKLAHSTTVKSARTNDMSTNSSARNGGFCGALQRSPPPLPPGLARRLANKENYGLGKVKVMLRVSDAQRDGENTHFMMVDKKKRQVNLTDPSMAALNVAATSTTQERAPMVAAPKMFAFDNLFTADDQQADVCASALSEVIPAVLEGSDGCLLTIGYPGCGQSQSMLGAVNPPNELGAIPCAISWLYKGINERRQKSGARFSVRVSALGISATKPDSTAKDLLAAHATDSDDSPGVYLRDDFLGGPTELRAPTAERAALFLDAALTGRSQGGLEPAMIFTLHVYQYSLSRKGGVAGGRSRLHLIDLGGCANRSGGLPLSGIGNILLAILSGQRHPPNKDHPLTPLLKDCLAPLTCHVAIVAHVMHRQSHTDALTTIQLASRIHRLRRRKHRYPLNGGGCGAGDKSGVTTTLNGHQSTGSSAGSGADPSSSELSADTVIYMGPSDDATDGEHPPVYLPSLSSGDNRAIMSKALKGSVVEKQQSSPSKVSSSAKKCSYTKAPASPIIQHGRTGSFKRVVTVQPNNTSNTSTFSNEPQSPFFSPAHSAKTLTYSNSSPLRHGGMPMMCSKASNVPTPKSSPLRRPGVVGAAAVYTNELLENCASPKRLISEECWVDGPRVSRARVAEARHLLREVNHVKQCETWIDGPKFQSSQSLTAGNLPMTSSQAQGYGFMDSHKKCMIRQWVEYQTSQVFHTASVGSSPTHAHRDQQAQHLRNITYHMSQLKQKSLDNPGDLYNLSTKQKQQQKEPLLANEHHSLHGSNLELANPVSSGVIGDFCTKNPSAPVEKKTGQYNRQNSVQSQPYFITNNDEADLHSTHSLHNSMPKIYGSLNATTSLYLPTASASDTGQRPSNNMTTPDCDEDQDSGPSEVPPALPLIEPLGSREISHESLQHILSRHISRESLYHQQQQELQKHQLELRRQEEQQHKQRQLSHQSSTPHYSQKSTGRSDCGLQVTEEEIARTMAGEHPLAALSHCDNMSVVSSFHAAGDAFSDCAIGERTRNQFDQLARLREIFTSQLAMAEVTPVFRAAFDLGSVYSEPAYRFNTGPGSVCSEPPYRPPSPRKPSRSPSQGSLPSLNGIMQIAGMEQYASLRHPDGASDPNLPKLEKSFVVANEDMCEEDEKTALISKRPSLDDDEVHDNDIVSNLSSSIPLNSQSQLPLLPLNTVCEAYDSGHDSSTPRTSKHSGISRRAESGYHSVATARDSDESSFTSGLSKEHHNRITVKRKRQEKGLCTWLMNPFTCTYAETEGEISDF